MAFVLTPFSVVSALTAILASVVAVVTWPRRAVPGATSLIWLMAAAAEWAVGASLEYASVGVGPKIFWSKVEYIGAVSSPVFFLLFALQYSGLDRWLTPRRVAALFVVPLITLGLAITNERHGLIWSGFSPSPDGNNLLIYRHDWGYWLGVMGYSYLAMLAGTALLAWAVIHFPARYRPQSGTLLAGAFIPWVGDIIYNLGRSPLQGLELTPLMLTGAGAAFGLSMMQFKLLDLVPVARGALIEMMTEGVLVLDSQGRILDLNPASRRLLDLPDAMTPGRNIREALTAWPEFVAALSTIHEGRVEMPLAGVEQGFWELNVSPVRNRDGTNMGKLVVMQDITERKRVETELQKTHEALLAHVVKIQALQDELREQALRDSLTQLFNRRYLDESLERELVRAVYAHIPLSLVVVDIDHFKVINDTFGHKGGDELLRAFGALLREKTRREDIPCRFGGEEFVIVLPRTDADAALRRVQEWRVAFEQILIPSSAGAIHATFSAGIASYPTNGMTAEELLAAGDRALYVAKASGRNQIILG